MLSFKSLILFAISAFLLLMKFCLFAIALFLLLSLNPKVCDPKIYFSSPQYILFLSQRSHIFPCWKSHTIFFSLLACVKSNFRRLCFPWLWRGCSLYLTLKWVFTVPEGVLCDHSLPREGNVPALSVVPTENVCGCFICLFSEMFSYGHMSLSAWAGLGHEGQASTSPEAHSNRHRQSVLGMLIQLRHQDL